MRILKLAALTLGLGSVTGCWFLGDGFFGIKDPGNTRNLSVTAPAAAINGQPASWQFTWNGGKPPYNIGLEIWRVDGSPDFQWYSVDPVQRSPYTATIAVQLPDVTAPETLRYRAYVDGSADGSTGLKPVPDMADVSEDGTFWLQPAP